MNDVVEHRPPLKRVQIGSSISVVRGEITEALSGISPVEQDRIWAITKQVAEGCNAPTASSNTSFELELVEINPTADFEVMPANTSAEPATGGFVYSPHEHIALVEKTNGRCTITVNFTGDAQKSTERFRQWLAPSRGKAIEGKVT